MLILFFMFLAYIGLSSAEQANNSSNGKISAIFGLIGSANLPVIHFSVEWWHSLHQATSISFVKMNSTIAPSMLVPLLAAALGASLLLGAIVLMRMRAEIARTKIANRMRRLTAEQDVRKKDDDRA